MPNILIAGGNGYLGRVLTRRLTKDGHSVNWLVRKINPEIPVPQFEFNLQKKTFDNKSLENTDALISLSGAGIIDRRWTKKYKQQIIDSRVKTNQLIFENLSKGNYRVQSFIGTSAVGYYGQITCEKIFTEEDESGNDFIAQCCREWENSYKAFELSGIRTCVLRLGVVMGAESKAFKNSKMLFEKNLGSIIGNGKQYFPWIHEEDAAGIYSHALKNISINGVYNAVADEQCSNKLFSETLAMVLSKKILLPPVPEFVLRILLGERAVTLTQGSRVANQKIKNTGYEFKFSTLEKALMDCLRQRH